MNKVLAIVVFIILLFGLIMGTGWAVETLPSGSITQQDCNTCEQMGPDTFACTAIWCPSAESIAQWEAVKAAKRRETCLAKMEAAMRAMEPFAFTKPGTAQEFMDALELFTIVKRECFRKETLP
jgi:uncharacterized protein YbdZ (MbtH family)